MANLISVRAPDDFLALLDRHSASRPDHPSRAAILREFAVRGIEAWERERLLLAREERIERARLAKAEARVARERSEAIAAERAKARAERKAARAQVPTWNGTAAGPEPPSQA